MIKVYKIRNKRTNEFYSKRGKTTWYSYPSEVIKHNPTEFSNREDWEIVVYEYQLVETTVEQLK